MSIEVRVPVLPESVADATLMSWHKKPGDRVRRDENLVDLETDKVVLEVPAPSDGILAEIRHKDGDTVAGNELLAVLEDAAGVGSSQVAAPVAATKLQAAANEEPVLTPALRRMLRQLKLDPSEIPATGKNGRLLKSDVIAFLDQDGFEDPGIGRLDDLDIALRNELAFCGGDNVELAECGPQYQQEQQKQQGVQHGTGERCGGLILHAQQAGHEILRVDIGQTPLAYICFVPCCHASPSSPCKSENIYLSHSLAML